MITLVDNNITYEYRNGIYVEVSDTILKKFFLNKLGDNASMYEVEEQFKKFKLKTSTFKMNIPLNLICLNNGILDIDTMILYSHDSKYHFFNKINVNYNANSKYDYWEFFVSQLVKPKDAELLQQFIGYCLRRDCIYQKALILYGQGANGKSTFLKIIENFFGHNNLMTNSLHQLEDEKYAVADLKDKFINVFSDLPKRALKESSIFKSLISGDTITAQRKFKHPFSFTPYAKLLFSCNQFPKSHDTSLSFFRRWIIINFPNTFMKNPDVNLEKIYSSDEQKSAILNWCIDGLKKLNQNGKFDVDENEMKALWTELIVKW